MQGIERSYCNVCINAVISAWRAMMETPAAETLRKTKYGKTDTLGLDAKPEICIAGRIRDYDNHAILVTEEEGRERKLEKRWPTDSKPERQPLMFFSDPTDRSKQLSKFFESISASSPLRKIGELMDKCNSTEIWEQMFEKPASVTGATISITCVRKGAIVFSIILNYIARTIYVSAASGNYQMQLPHFSDKMLDVIDFEYVVKNGRRLEFLTAKEICVNPDDAKRFVTFLGKTGYGDNFTDSKIFVEDSDQFLHHTEPGGPARVLYLSELQKGHGPIGFILANGEKIGEWIHWLSFARFAKNSQGGSAFAVFEIAIERPWTKEGVLMSTSPPYSIFCINEDGCTYLDISRLRNFDNPSKFRSMLVVMPYDNERMIYMMREHAYREIVL